MLEAVLIVLDGLSADSQQHSSLMEGFGLGITASLLKVSTNSNTEDAQLIVALASWCADTFGTEDDMEVRCLKQEILTSIINRME
jgi:hypothetical protein